MRVALYARYSDDRQNEKSAGDQLAALERIVAGRPGWVVVARFADEAISGETLSARPAMVSLLAAAAGGAFDIVMAEDLDRVARDQEASAHIRKRLTFAGVEMETLAQGRLVGVAGAMQAAFAGAMGEVFLHQLRHKTRRGLEARVRDGFSAGGLCYGYRPVRTLKDDGTQTTGILAIDEGEAAVIRRIFDDYAQGKPPRAIAHALNAQGVPGPRGGTWSPTTVSGDRRAGDGILCQELYIGVRVFNRRSFRKHPDTGARSSKLNPPEEWVRNAVPDLRIVTDEQWQAVQARQRRLASLPRAQARAPKRLLSGLLRCGLCQGPMTLNGPRYECAKRRERGLCSNRKTISAKAIEARVIEGVRARLLDTEQMAKAAREYQADMEAARRSAIANRLPLERDLAEVGRRIERATESYLAGGIELPAFHALLEPLKARKATLQADLERAAGGEQVVQLHPGAVEAYRQMAEGLREALADPDADEVRAEFRKLIARVDFTPLEGHGQFELMVHGQLSHVLQVAAHTKNPTTGANRLWGFDGCGSPHLAIPHSAAVAFAA
jgi:site-specific DNA recombinase